MKWSASYLSLLIATTFLFGHTAFATDIVSRRVIDSIGSNNSVVIDSNGRLAVSYHDTNDQDLELWVDDGRGGGTAGNGVVDGTELRTIDSAGIVGTFNSITLDFNGRLAISYYDETNEDLKLWYDDGRGGGTAGNGVADGTEIRTLDSTDRTGETPSITVDSNGRLAISYGYTSTSTNLRLWVDDGVGGGTAGNGEADGAEIRTIDPTPNAGSFSSITIDANNRLAISYFQSVSADLKVWIDDGRGGGTAGNGVSDGTEVRVIDSTGFVGLGSSITTDSNGRLAVSYQETISSDLRLWVDDGAGGGTAGNGVADGSEIRVIDSAASVAAATAITLDSNGRLAVGYLDSFSSLLKLWLDDGRGGGTALNGIADGTEIRTLEFASFPIGALSITLDSIGRLAIPYGDTFSLKLATVVEYGPLVLSPSFSVDTSVTLDANKRLAVSFADGNDEDLELWVDDGLGSGGIAGNRVVDGAEIRTLDATDSVGEYSSITLDSNNRLALSYFDRTNDDLKVWIDDGRGSGGVAGNKIADGTEIRIIDSAGDVGLYTSIVVDSNGRLAVAYYDATNVDLKLWVDDGRGGGTAGNGVAEGGEIRTLESTGDVGSLNSMTLDTNNRLAISYVDLTNQLIKLWVDDGRGGGTAGNGVADGTEIRSIDSTGATAQYTSIVAGPGGRLAVSYMDGTSLDLKLWLDDGRGGGTAGNGEVDGTEIRTIDSTGSVGIDSSITVDSDGRLVISYHDFTNLDLKLWIDNGSGSGGVAGNGVPDGTEVLTVDSAGSVGRFTSVILDSNRELVVAYGATNLKLFSQTRSFPDLDVRGNGVAITNGDSTASGTDDTDFGSQFVSSGTITKVFSVENLGGEPLVLGTSSVSLSGPAASDFSVSAVPRTVLRSGTTSNFTVVFDPSSAGQRAATVSITNSALNESPFTFAISGNGVPPTATPTATSTVTSTPTATATTTPTATPTVTPTITVIPTVTITPTATATATASPTATTIATEPPPVSPTGLPTVSATSTPTDPTAEFYRVKIIRRDPQRGLGGLRLVARNATASSIAVSSCLPIKGFNFAELRDYLLVLRNQNSTQRRKVRVRRNRACAEFTINLRGIYRIRFEQIFGKTVVRTSEDVLFGVE